MVIRPRLKYRLRGKREIRTFPFWENMADQGEIFPRHLVTTPAPAQMGRGREMFEANFARDVTLANRKKDELQVQ